jgi:amidohydrolase
MKQRIQDLANLFTEKVIAIRRHLHQYPELSFNEVETSKYIIEQLKPLGVEIQSGIVKTGIVVVIKGKNPTKKTIALRGDIDALPIQEQTQLPFASKNDGVMHACGHDMHTASLIGCAFILNELRNEFEGTIKLLFQPGEELLPGGAKLMIEAGVLENPTVESIFGQHVYPELPVGKVGFKSGMYMASADEIYLTITGKGGHAALPQYFIDPILIASHVIVALQQITSRKANPSTPTVLSFGYIEGKGATNVIPNEVKLKGTFRTFDEKWRFEAHEHIRSIVSGIVTSMGGTFDLDIKVGYPFLTNEPITTEFAKECAIEYLGQENVVDLELRMTAEDFAYYSQQTKGCFYRLGTSNKSKNISGSLHHPNVQFDDDALTTAMGLMSFIALKELA